MMRFFLLLLFACTPVNGTDGSDGASGVDGAKGAAGPAGVNGSDAAITREGLYYIEHRTDVLANFGERAIYCDEPSHVMLLAGCVSPEYGGGAELTTAGPLPAADDEPMGWLCRWGGVGPTEFAAAGWCSE